MKIIKSEILLLFASIVSVEYVIVFVSLGDVLHRMDNKKGKTWRAMKLVVLGHGRIGKTTLVNAIRGLSKKVPLTNY